jgi:Na+/H+ antiporter NhaD/arsenite permease-like protein
MQLQVQCNPLKGFWLVSAAAFLVAPFLTNDGVCLLFVELILDAFDATKSISNNSHLNTTLSSPEQRAKIVLLQEMPLETGDAIYFLLTLACSANIGSALTYTGLFYHYLLLQYQYFLSISLFFFTCR